MAKHTLICLHYALKDLFLEFHVRFSHPLSCIVIVRILIAIRVGPYRIKGLKKKSKLFKKFLYTRILKKGIIEITKVKVKC